LKKRISFCNIDESGSSEAEWWSIRNCENLCCWSPQVLWESAWWVLSCSPLKINRKPGICFDRRVSQSSSRLQRAWAYLRGCSSLLTLWLSKFSRPLLKVSVGEGNLINILFHGENNGQLSSKGKEEGR
jgi:hypothetical protein